MTWDQIETKWAAMTRRLQGRPEPTPDELPAPPQPDRTPPVGDPPRGAALAGFAV